MKRKIIFLLLLLSIFSFVLPQKIYAEETKNNNDSEITVLRARVRQVNKTENVQCYSSTYGSYAITIYINGTVTLDSNGNVISDNLNISYVCKFPFEASYNKTYYSNTISLSFNFIVTYPNSMVDIILKSMHV